AALCIVLFFFFSSRRRHTSFSRDWSSDVCSSDLVVPRAVGLVIDQTGEHVVENLTAVDFVGVGWDQRVLRLAPGDVDDAGRCRRSEERRVGKEGRARGGPEAEEGARAGTVDERSR